MWAGLFYVTKPRWTPRGIRMAEFIHMLYEVLQYELVSDSQSHSLRLAESTQIRLLIWRKSSALRKKHRLAFTEIHWECWAIAAARSPFPNISDQLLGPTYTGRTPPRHRTHTACQLGPYWGLGSLKYITRVLNGNLNPLNRKHMHHGVHWIEWHWLSRDRSMEP